MRGGRLSTRGVGGAGTQAGEDEAVAVGAILEEAADAADRGTAGADALFDLFVGPPGEQQTRDLQPLGQGLHLSDGAHVFEEPVALLNGLQREQSPAQLVDLRIFEFRIYSGVAASRGHAILSLRRALLLHSSKTSPLCWSRLRLIPEHFGVRAATGARRRRETGRNWALGRVRASL